MTVQHSGWSLTIDQGGHASRAIVFDEQGRLIAQAEYAIATLTPRLDWVEHDAAAVVDSVYHAITDLLQQLGRDSHRIRAAGLATQRASIVCWDRNSGRPLSPVLSWQDCRNRQWLTRFTHKQAWIHKKTGLKLSPHYGASKIRWCLDHLSPVQQALEEGCLAIGPLASYLLFRLLEQRPLLADPANASRTQLWHLGQQRWDKMLLTLYDIPEAILPHCCHSRHHFGDLDISGRKIPLILTTGDQSAALFAWGEPQPETAYINLGTGAFVQRITPTPLHSDKLLTSVVYSSKQRRCYTLEGTLNGAARALQWFAQREGIDNLEQRLPEWMEEIENPPLFLNGVAGLAAPDWVADFESRFIGKGTLPARAVAVAESIVFLLQRIMVESEHHLSAAKQLQISGGLASLSPLCQRLADLTGRPIYRPNTLEATARGLAYLITRQPEHWPITKEKSTLFTPQTAPGLTERYCRWKAKLEQALSEEKGGVGK